MADPGLTSPSGPANAAGVSEDYAELRERIAEALSEVREVNGGELESVLTIYTPEGLAVLVLNALGLEQVGWTGGYGTSFEEPSPNGAELIPVYVLNPPLSGASQVVRSEPTESNRTNGGSDA